jgi:hypothetical protein
MGMGGGPAGELGSCQMRRGERFLFSDRLQLCEDGGAALMAFRSAVFQVLSGLKESV